MDTEYNVSDHNTIVFKIDVEEVCPRESRPWKKAGWIKFTDSLNKLYSPPERITCKKLDKEVGNMYRDLEVALDIACPKVSHTPQVKESLWYCDKLCALHHRVRKQFKKAMASGVQEEIEKYNELHRKFLTYVP